VNEGMFVLPSGRSQLPRSITSMRGAHEADCFRLRLKRNSKDLTRITLTFDVEPEKLGHKVGQAIIG